MSALRGRVAVVTGASRGVGKGIALALGKAGATVYLTGRSDEGSTTEGLPGTGGYEHLEWSRFVAPFWEQPLQHWSGMFESGVRAHLVSTRLAVPLMFSTPRGLIIHTTAWDRDKYLGNLFYDVAKAAANRMAFGMARELEVHQVAVVALAPGFVRTERVLAAFAGADQLPENLESPEYIGRAVVALAADANVMAKSGRVLTVGQLALEYGFTDIDGRQLPPFQIEA